MNAVWQHGKRQKLYFSVPKNGLDTKNLKKRNIRATEIQPFRVFGLQYFAPHCSARKMKKYDRTANRSSCDEQTADNEHQERLNSSSSNISIEFRERNISQKASFVTDLVALF